MLLPRRLSIDGTARTIPVLSHCCSTVKKLRGKMNENLSILVVEFEPQDCRRHLLLIVWANKPSLKTSWSVYFMALTAFIISTSNAMTGIVRSARRLFHLVPAAGFRVLGLGSSDPRAFIKLRASCVVR